MLRAVLLAVVLGAVWFLWRAIAGQRAASAPAPLDPTLPSPAEAAATAECPVCRAYVPISAEDGCGREDCPIPDLAAAMAAEAAASGEPPRKPDA